MRPAPFKISYTHNRQTPSQRHTAMKATSKPTPNSNQTTIAWAPSERGRRIMSEKERSPMPRVVQRPRIKNKIEKTQFILIAVMNMDSWKNIIRRWHTKTARVALRQTTSTFCKFQNHHQKPSSPCTGRQRRLQSARRCPLAEVERPRRGRGQLRKRRWIPPRLAATR